MVTSVIRTTDSPYGGEFVELVAFSAHPDEREAFDPSATTATVRAQAMDHCPRITFEERREYTDAGGSGEVVIFILELLGSGAAGVAFHELYQAIKAHLRGATRDHLEIPSEPWFVEDTLDRVQESTLIEAEQWLGVGRGEPEAEEVERTPERVRAVVRRRSTGTRYEVIRDAESSFWMRRLEAGSSGATSASGVPAQAETLRSAPALLARARRLLRRT